MWNIINRQQRCQFNWKLMNIFLFDQSRWQTWLCHLSLRSCMKYFLNTKNRRKTVYLERSLDLGVFWTLRYVLSVHMSWCFRPKAEIFVVAFHYANLEKPSSCLHCIQWKMDSEMVALHLWIQPRVLPSQASLGFVAWGFFTQLVGQERVLGCSLCIRSL